MQFIFRITMCCIISYTYKIIICMMMSVMVMMFMSTATFVIMFIVAMKFDLEKKLPGIREELDKRKAQNK